MSYKVKERPLIGSVLLLNTCGELAPSASESFEVDTASCGYVAGEITVSAAATLKVYHALLDTYGAAISEALLPGDTLPFDLGQFFVSNKVLLEVIAGAGTVTYTITCRGKA